MRAKADCPNSNYPITKLQNDRIQIVVDHARTSARRCNPKLLVVRHHARRAFLQFVRQSAAAGPGGLFHFFWISAQAQPRHGRTGKRVLRAEPPAASRRVSGRPNAEERAWSLEQSSMLNDAYRTLKDPIKRTEYLLRLEGVELEEQSKQATEKARATGRIEEAGRASRSFGGSLRTQHASGRTAGPEEDGRRRPRTA